MSGAPSAEIFDAFPPQTQEHPYEVFKKLREEAPLDRVRDLSFAPGKNDLGHPPHGLLQALVSLHIEFEPDDASR